MSSKRENVFLDLDNTLVSAEPIEKFPFNESGMKEKATKFKIHNMDDYYIVFERPFVQEFLDFLFDNYNVCVFTAASKDYALFILDKILLKRSNRKLDYFFFSYHCDISAQIFDYSKKLKMLFDIFKLDGFNKKNTIIIDDLDEVYECQPDNCINIKAFEILDEGCENDTELKKMPKRIREKFINLRDNN
jgi:TFIIF-interacting CTD phosphatase-like protein